VLNEDGDTENLIFQEDGYVLVSINGSAKKFTWNFIPQNQSLTIMHTDTDGTMLKPAFMDGKVLAFNKIGTKECMFLVDDSWSDNEKMLSLASMKKYLLDIENRAIAAELEVERKKKEEEEVKDEEPKEEKKDDGCGGVSDSLPRYTQSLSAIEKGYSLDDAFNRLKGRR
jgi:hypothetical protein